jgi:hypothetical protein
MSRSYVECRLARKLLRYASSCRQLFQVAVIGFSVATRYFRWAIQGPLQPRRRSLHRMRTRCSRCTACCNPDGTRYTVCAVRYNCSSTCADRRNTCYHCSEARADRCGGRYHCSSTCTDSCGTRYHCSETCTPRAEPATTAAARAQTGAAPATSAARPARVAAARAHVATAPATTVAARARTATAPVTIAASPVPTATGLLHLRQQLQRPQRPLRQRSGHL